MYWTALIFAGIFEMVGVLSINHLHKHRNFTSFILLGGSFILSFTLLSFSMEELAMSIAYPVWTGIGTVGVTIMGILLFNEPASRLRILFIFCIIAATVGLKFIS
ncbi:DMT family transporter [Halalkalibacillus halophilus]|uniref:DMT family transporter n=1 Tax=Halalkalibacillus halophilus TaxID=392827 RepID=UPI0003F60A17|nr:multidrug efflux SMR transporter [Halalkalibacillus halophilus]